MGTCLTTLYIRVKFNILWKWAKALLNKLLENDVQSSSTFYFRWPPKVTYKKIPMITNIQLVNFLSEVNILKINILGFLQKLEHIRLAYIQTLKYTQNLQNLKELKFCFASSDNHIWRKKFVLPTFSNTSIFPERSNLYIFDVL